MKTKGLTGYPAIDRPWLDYYSPSDIDAEPMKGTMYQYMFCENKDRMDKTALSYFGKKITYQAMHEKIEQTAKALVASGVKKGDIVSICLLTAPEFLYLLYAVNKLGAICSFLAVNANEQTLHQQLASSHSKVVFCIDMITETMLAAIKGTEVTEVVSISLTDSMPFPYSLLGRIKYRNRKISAVLGWKTFLERQTQTLQHLTESDESLPAVIEYTSGTTGVPKGALLSNAAANGLAFHYSHMSDMLSFHKGDTFLDILPPFYAYGVFFGAHMPLSLGLELILYPNPAPKGFSSLIKKYRPNHFSAGPLHIDDLMKNRRIRNMDLSFLVTAAFGGDAVSKAWEENAATFLRSHGAESGLMQGYGMTEMAGSFCTSTHKYQFMIPFVKNNIRIINPDTGEDLKYGQEGEICVSGPTMMLGYYQNEDETERIIWTENGRQWMHTGDLGVVLENGSIQISGRLKRIYWTVGDRGIYRVFPMNIENILCMHKNVRQSAVIGVKDGDRGYRSVAYIVLVDENEEKNTLNELVTLCKDRLEESSQPVKYYFLTEMPVTPAGKIDYRALEEMAAAETINA